MSIEAKLLHLQSIQNLLAPYRYLYCVDLEATCDEVGESESPRPLAVVPDQMETIEVGLVVIDLETLETIDEFQRFVRPQINPILSANMPPRRAEYQGLKLLGIQLHFTALPSAWPMEFTLVQATCRQPDANPIVYQHFHPSRAAIGKQIGAVRLRRTEHRAPPSQRRFSAGAHIQGLGGEPYGVDADHRNKSRRNAAQAAALSIVGNCTLLDHPFALHMTTHLHWT
jgi:hypothetical protein